MALDLPAGLRDALAALASPLPGARWVRPDNLHLTLRFLGEVVGPTLEEVDYALAALRAPPFTLTLSGLGSFERHGRTTLWAGVERSEMLDRLQGKIETAMQRAGLAAERRRFLPHVSLATVEPGANGVLGEWIVRRSLFRAPPAQIDHFSLFSSKLGSDQPVYVAEAEYPLV